MFMKKLLVLAVGFFVLLGVIGCSLTDQPTAVSDDNTVSSEEHMSLAKAAEARYIPDQYIVVFKEDVADVATNVRALASANGARVKHVYETGLKGFAANMSAQAAANLSRHPKVKYIEQDQIVTVNKGKPGGGGSDPVQTVPWGITRVNGGVTYTGNNVAWVLDTGIDLDHPDLNVELNDPTRPPFTAYYKRRNKPVYDDGDGHGTHVAGTIAAIDNGIGVVGVAAGAKVIPVKVLSDQGSGSYSDVIAGINHVGQYGKPGDVANMSLGGGFSQAVNDAVIAASAQVKFALAAGNESTDANTKSPASANGSNIYTVSAMNSSDTWASFSNYGNPPVDYCAPGVSIYSTYKGGGYATLSGTSMATPHVAGILLLGNIRTDGYVIGDPDGQRDPIAVH